MDVVIADHGESGAVISIMTEADVRLALKDPARRHRDRFTGERQKTDRCRTRSLTRAVGVDPAYSRHRMRDERLLTLEEAIRRKMTSRPASRVGVSDRGILRAVAWRAATSLSSTQRRFRDVATFTDSNRYSVGLKWVVLVERPPCRGRWPNPRLSGRVERCVDPIRSVLFRDASSETGVRQCRLTGEDALFPGLRAAPGR